MKVSTVIFDLDGTLSDPSEGIVKCVNHALARGGYEPLSDQEISAEIGPPLDLMFRKFIADVTMAEIETLVGFYRERFATDGFAENHLYNGIPEALRTLSAAGFDIAVCTSKPEPAARKILKHFNLLQYMRFVSGGDIGVAKQSQLQKLLSESAIDDQAVMVGDRGVDLSAAHNNGLRATGVLWGFGSEAELAAESPELVLETVPQLSTAYQPL